MLIIMPHDHAMRTARRYIISLLIVVVSLAVSGCMSSQAVFCAKGYTCDLVTPEKGDMVFQATNTSWYVIPQKLTNYYKIPSNRRQVVAFTGSSDLPRNVYVGWVSAYEKPQYMCYAYKPNAAYYFLLPLTVPLDVATSPFQLLLYLAFRNASLA
jgi:hypothetical protein